MKHKGSKVPYLLKRIHLWYNETVKNLTEIESEMKEILKQFRPFDFILIGLALQFMIEIVEKGEPADDHTDESET